MFKLAKFFMLFCFFNAILTQQESCATISEIDQEICATFAQTDCLINLQILIGGEEYFSQQVTLQQLADSNGRTFCSPTSYQDCELCFLWEESAVQQEGSMEGCITMTSSCLSDPIYLNCFSDQSVQICHHECPNNCTGNGECQHSGVCNCFSSYRGDDCSSQCYSSLTGIEKIDENSSQKIYKATPDQDFIGYIQIDPQLAFLGLIASLNVDNMQINTYIEKSCYPDIENSIYDKFFVTKKGENGYTEIVSDCNAIDGGFWFVRVVCLPLSGEGSCSFSLTLLQEKIEKITAGSELTLQNLSNSPSKYYSFSVYSLFTIELTAKSSNLQIEIMKSQCPQNNIYLFSATKPFLFQTEDEFLFKYLISSPSASYGVYYLRVKNLDFNPSLVFPHFNNNLITRGEEELLFNLTINYATCSPICEFGYCISHNQCKCANGFVGLKCDQIDHSGDQDSDQSPDSSITIYHNSENQITGGSAIVILEDDQDQVDTLNADGIILYFVLIIIGCLGGFIFVCFLVVVFVCCVCFCVRKRKQSQINKNLSPTNLYNLLTNLENEPI